MNLEGAEPPIRSVVEGLGESLARPGAYRELLISGFGEPTMRMEAVNSAGLFVRLHHPDLPIRLETLGLGNLIQGRNLIPELALFLDSISVSLNTADANQWEELHRPSAAFRERGFQAVLDFIAGCVAAGLKTRVTAIERADVDVAAVAFYARAVGADYRLLPRLP